MKILHVLKHPTDESVRRLIASLPGDQGTEFYLLYQEPVDYDRLVDFIFESDQVITWF
ncbi:MAG: hypothetical protein AB1641_11675 [Thermodesulfobacteriota bacterium]